MRPSLPTAGVLALAFLLMLPAISSALSASKVTLNFMCPCGACDEALSTCECPSSDGYRSQIAGMVGRGYTEEQIIDNFKGQFGPQVLIANAGMAPDSGGRTIDKRTIGIILLLASFSLAAFGLGKYMKPAPVPAKRRSKSRTKPQARSSTKSNARTSKDSGKRGKSDKGFREGVDDDLLDDYDYK